MGQATKHLTREVMLMIDSNRIKPLFENLITLDELMASLRGQYTKGTLYQWVHQGMPKEKIGGKLWFDRGQVSRWIKVHKEESNGDQKAR